MIRPGVRPIVESGLSAGTIIGAPDTSFENVLFSAPGRLAPQLGFQRAQISTKATALAANNSTWLEYDADAPRFTGASGKLLIAGQRTNGIRNPRGEGLTLGVIGAGGVLPTNWTLAAGGLSAEILSRFVENGIDVVRIRFSGVADTNQMILEFEATNTVVSLPSQTWALSMFFRVVASPAPGNYNFRCVSRINTSPQGIVNYAFAPSGSLSRYSQLHTTASDPLINRISWGYRSGFIIGQPYDFTLDFGWPQTEQGDFASTPVLPPVGSPVSATRGQDNVTAVLASLGITGACTILWTGTLPQNAPAAFDQTLFQLNDGSDTNRIRVRNLGGGASIVAGRTTSGVSSDAASLGNMTAGTAVRCGATYNPSTGRLAACLANGTVQSITGGPTGLTTLRLGNDFSGISPLFGEVATAIAIPFALSDADLLSRVNALSV